MIAAPVGTVHAADGFGPDRGHASHCAGGTFGVAATFAHHPLLGTDARHTGEQEQEDQQERRRCDSGVPDDED
jgi:hypothetical protein